MEQADNRHHHNNNINFNQLWAKYFPYWPAFLILAALGSGGAWLYLHYKLPVYESTASILIKDEKKGLEDSKMMESINMLSSKKIIENEMEVFKSRTLVKAVVQELLLYAPVYEVGKWLDLPAYSTSPIKIQVRNPDVVVDVKRVDFNYQSASKEITIKGRKYMLNHWVNTPWGELKFLPAKGSYNSAGQFYFSLVHPKKITQQLIKNIDITTSNKLSSVINLKLKDAVPERSEDILNTLILTYNKAAISDKNTLAYNTLLFLDERLRFISGGLDSIEKQLQQYKARKGAIDLSSQGKLFLENVSGNDQKLSDVNMKLAVLKQVEQYVFSNDTRGGLVPSTLGVDDPLLTNLLEKLYKAELDYEKLKRTTGENNPDLLSIRDQIQKIKPGILENIHSQQQSLEANKRNLYTTNTAYSSLIQALPQQERDLVEISREQNVKSAIYSFLLQKREEAALSNSAMVSDTRLIDKAESSLDPVGLGNKYIYAFAVLLAIGLGIAFITIRDLLTNTILFRKEIETITDIPVIGEIALDKSSAPLVISEGSSGLISEEFRLLRTSLFYLGTEVPGKKILITSTIPGEGKSFVAVNLAISLALSGKKVVLAEFDLKNPTIAKKLKIDNTEGVADFLTSRTEVNEIIRPVENNPNLFIVTAGNLPHNPSELLLSDRTPQLLDYLKNHFDFVIIDSAPVGILSDAYVLSRFSDATLYIVRHKKTPKKMLERLEKNIKINELKNLAIVFNGVSNRGFGNNSYGYGYDYGYMYAKSNDQSNRLKV